MEMRRIRAIKMNKYVLFLKRIVLSNCSMLSILALPKEFSRLKGESLSAVESNHAMNNFTFL